MYSIQTRVRYTEVDEQGALSLFSLINYFQDCSTFHSEDLGVGMTYLDEKGLAWWLLNWQIDIIRMPVLGEEIEVGTFAYDFKTFFGMRNFFMKDKAGNLICKADSKWIHMDLAKQRPVKADQDIVRLYLAHETKPFVMREAKMLQEDLSDVLFETKVIVSRFFLDTYRHINNARYVDIAMECLQEYLEQEGISDARKIISLNADYKLAATLGDVLLVKGFAFDKGYVVHIDGEQKSFAKIIFYTKE